MDSTITMQEARELVADSLVWPRVRDFLWDFTPQIHHSWLEGVEGYSEALMKIPRFRRHVLEALGIEKCFHKFPSGDWSRLLLLDGETIEMIAKWLGALAYAKDLRRVTSGKEVKVLKAALTGIYPDVFTYTMYFKGLDAAFDAQGSENRAQTIVREGLGMIASVIKPLPAALAARLKYKLPKESSAIIEEAETNVPREAIEKALPRLLKLKFPEAFALCCS